MQCCLPNTTAKRLFWCDLYNGGHRHTVENSCFAIFACFPRVCVFIEEGGAPFAVGTTTTTTITNQAVLTGGVRGSLEGVQFLPFGVRRTIDEVIGHGKISGLPLLLSPVYQWADARLAALLHYLPRSVRQTHGLLRKIRLKWHQTVHVASVREPTRPPRHIFTVSHRPSRLVRLADYTPLTIFRSEQHNDLELDHTLSHTFLTNMGPPQPAIDLLAPYCTSKDTSNLHGARRFTGLIQNSTRSRAGKMAAVDETFSTLVRKYSVY